ncbi:MAG: LamG domain-containing protein [Proteobacteria bacterium]|nr:LamG domain-containing protein [Pseudomonadota bacterium]
MFIAKDKIQHLNSITHEGKVVVFATDADGKISYTVKQDGFEDSYLNTPPELRTGWENWKAVEFPNEADDASVIDKEKAELTYQLDPSKFILRSRYKTQDQSAIAPVQIISALGHLYVFRQSKSNTLLVDRFVLDGMTNKLNRKLEVRFKRSRQRHTPTKNMKKASSGLVNIDSVDFRDANGNFFYEPTTEVCVVNSLYKGWFSVVRVPTIENDVFRWHIFAYNSQSQKVELTTLRASDDGLFDAKDYTIFEESNDALVPRKIPGVIKRSLDMAGVTVTNGLSATSYDLQQEQETQSGDKQLLKTATRLLLAVPTDKGAASLSFAIAGDGTLAEINETPSKTVLRTQQREVLLPLNTLDEIKAWSDRTPPPQGVITALSEATDEDDAEDWVKITTVGKAAELANGDWVKITNSADVQGLYRTRKIDANAFEIDLGPSDGLGYWEKEDSEAGGLIFDGMITAYEKTADGKLRVTCADHGLENGDEVQIVGTDTYNDTFPVQKIDDTHFVIERQWATGEAVNVRLLSAKWRGLVFDGVDDYVALPEMNHDFSRGITVEAWVWYDSFASWSRMIDLGNGPGPDNILLANALTSNKLSFQVHKNGVGQAIEAEGVLELGKWMHLAATIDAAGNASLYKNGVVITTGKLHLPNPVKRSTSYIGKSNWPDSLFNGKISDLRFWTVARTAEDIKDSMYLQLAGNEIGLVGYWRLGGISENKLIDFSVNGNDGTVYGDPYVSAATLTRKLAGGADAVKYANPELFAVSQRSTYEESFEFKVNSPTPVNLAYLDNADGRGNKIFAFAHWGKTSRSAEVKSPVAAKQNPFEDVGRGWFRASCTFTIPDGVSMLRSYEIANVKGNWQSLEIRKHRVRLLSDSITEAKYTDGMTLISLADNQNTLVTKLNQLQFKEPQEAQLLKEKRELEEKIAAYSAQAETRARIEALTAWVPTLTSEEQTLSARYNAALNSPFNYYCVLSPKPSGDRRVQGIDRGNGSIGLELTSHPFNEWQKIKFNSTGDGFYVMSIENLSVQGIDRGKGYIGLELTSHPFNEWQKIKFNSTGDGFYVMSIENLSFQCVGRWGCAGMELAGQPINALQQFKLTIQNNQQSNNNIPVAYEYWQNKIRELKQAQEELNRLRACLTATPADKAAWDARLTQLLREITALQTELNTLNTDFINGVVSTQNKPQTMPQVAKDGKGLVTQGALLGFVQSASRLNAIETSEGNVQLSYFDSQGRMRQTNYDVTADSANASFEQWIPDALRTCLNFSNAQSKVVLNQALYLPGDWSIEAWFVSPLPEAGEWNTLCRGQQKDHHIIVRNRKQLGIFLNDAVLGQNFFESGFNLETLPLGWHHFAAVGKGETTLFYIDGQRVGDTKAKAVADAQIALAKAPNDANAKKKLDDIKKASLKSQSDVYAIGNIAGGGQPFGKLAEVRIWGLALNDDEVAVNSKTLLSGNEPGLLAYYPFNEARGETVRDQTGNGHEGVASAANWWACNAPIGNPGTTVLKFDGVNDHVSLPPMNPDFTKGITVELWVWYDSFASWSRLIDLGTGPGPDNILLANALTSNKLSFQVLKNGVFQAIEAEGVLELGKWMHLAATIDASGNACLYKNGKLIQTARVQLPNTLRRTSNYIGRSNWSDSYFNGKISDMRFWTVARSPAEIQASMYNRLSGKEANLVAYYPLNGLSLADSTPKALDLAGNNHGTVIEALAVSDNALPLSMGTCSDALISCEYSTVTIENNRKVALMRRFFAYPANNGAMLLPEKRVEALELRWIGNAQFAPTLLGYIEGPPPVPSENLTLSDDYNSATSVELTMTEDVAFSWNRSQDSGLGANAEIFAGAETEAEAGLGFTTKVATMRAGFKGNIDFSYQFQNESSITASSSLNMTDKLELRGTQELTPKFPHLGKRYIPKNIGYALVVSALADVFVTRLARTGRMIGYQVQPVDGIPPDVNTITFLMNPAYTMNGSLDGLTGSRATSDRFFKHIPEMRSQYGSLYPASYYRLQEAYDLKRQIEAEDKRRESYFSNFDVRLVDETSLDRNIDSGPASSNIGLQREEDKPDPNMTEADKNKAAQAKLDAIKTDADKNVKDQSKATNAKQAEIKSKISDREKQAQATNSFANWQKRMEDIQIRAGKCNIINTYVWDADGGLRTEAQSFANTVEHSIGGSFALNAALGAEAKFGAMATVELTAQATVNLTQTMSKTEARSKGFELNVDLGGVECKGITDYNDRPIVPGEKVDRYRFMSFFLEGSTSHFQDFFSYVVDPEWLRSNDEEARALRQAQAGKPNKAWRVLHRVTYVERPALMGFGRDTRTLMAAAETSEYQQLLDKVAKLESNNQGLSLKLDKILGLLKSK